MTVVEGLDLPDLVLVNLDAAVAYGDDGGAYEVTAMLDDDGEETAEPNDCEQFIVRLGAGLWARFCRWCVDEKPTLH